MSSFSNDNYQHTAPFNVTPPNLVDQLIMIDVAYQADDREACIAMIDDLYAAFDQLD